MFTVLRKLQWFFAKEKKRYMWGIGLLAASSVLDVVLPWLLGYTIDGLYLGTMDMQHFVLVMGIWLATTLLLYIMGYVWHLHLFSGAFVLERIMRSRLMGQFLRMTPTFYERNRTGDLMARATNDLGAVSVTAGFGMMTLFDSTFYLLMILIVMVFAISWKLTLAALLPLPIIAFIMKHYGNKIHERFMEAQKSFGELNDQVLESVAGVRVIRAFVQEKVNAKEFSDKTEEVYQRNIEVAKIDSLFEPTIKVLVGISYVTGLCYGGYLVFQNEISLGELVSFNVFLGMLIWPMFAIGELINIMQRGNASLDRVDETLSYVPEVQDGSVKADSEERVSLKSVTDPDAILFEGVTFQYPSSKQPNLTDISFEIKRGQTLGIVGRTGSGKTTVLKQLLREYPLGEGNIRMGNASIDAFALDELRGWFGYVPQQPVLFSRSIRDNILFGSKTPSEEAMLRALDRAAFAKDVTFLPDGLDTMVGEKGVALSGGQKQRVSIARALIADPPILLLDDALSAVDGRTEAEIIEGIRTERAGKTTIITTHRLSAIQHADHIIVLDQGRIVQSGTHEELAAVSGWYREQYERQQLDTE